MIVLIFCHIFELKISDEMCIKWHGIWSLIMEKKSNIYEIVRKFLKKFIQKF